MKKLFAQMLHIMEMWLDLLITGKFIWCNNLLIFLKVIVELPLFSGLDVQHPRTDFETITMNRLLPFLASANAYVMFMRVNKVMFALSVETIRLLPSINQLEDSLFKVSVSCSGFNCRFS